MSRETLEPADPPSEEVAALGAGPVPGAAGSLIRLGAIVVAVAVVATLAGVGKTVAVVAAIIAMIMLHELGHFATAKWADMKVTEYFLGFGPKLWSIRKGETEYGVKALPLGGYVKIVGMNNLEEVDPGDEVRAYRQKPFLRRLSVAVAGSTMHFLLALVLLFVFFFVTGELGDPTMTVGAVASFGATASPAQQAGLRAGDTIVSIDGQHFASTTEASAYIRNHPGQRLDLVVERAGGDVHLYPTPVEGSKLQLKGYAPPPANGPDGIIGVSFKDATIHYGFLASISESGGRFVDISARTFDALGSLVSAHGISSYSHMLVNQRAADAPTANRFVSPVGIVRVANTAAGNGLRDVLGLLILINIFVGIFNLLPLLPLDGGHVAIAVYEAVRSRRGRAYHADITKLLPLTYAVFVVLVFIGVSALFLDVRDLLAVVRF